MEQRAKLFTNGGSQAVRLPAEFRFEGTEVAIRRDPVTGDVILSQDSKETGWARFLELRNQLKPEDIPEGWPFRDQEPDIERKLFEDWDKDDL